MSEKTLSFEEQNKKLLDEIAQLKKAQLPVLPGFIVRTANPAFSGEVLGVVFRAGVALVPKSNETAKTLFDLQFDLGYAVQEVPNLLDIDGAKASLIDMVTNPTIQ